MTETETKKLDCVIDLEWIELIKEARELGLTIDEIKEFFSSNAG
jgi:DNA-binding transcriptional MerR regulator